MIDKKLPIEDEANALALQVDGYREMMAGRGWKDLKAEIDFHVAGLEQMLKTCDLDKLRGLQGEIAGFEWLMGHFTEVGERLESLLKHIQENKAETTE